MYFAVTLRKRKVHLINGEVLELPRVISFRLGQAIQAIPLRIERRRELLFVLPSLFSHVELKRGDRFFFRSVITGKRIHQALDSGLRGRVKDDVRLLSNALLLMSQIAVGLCGHNRLTNVDKERYVKTVELLA